MSHGACVVVVVLFQRKMTSYDLSYLAVVSVVIFTDSTVVVRAVVGGGVVDS